MTKDMIQLRAVQEQLLGAKSACEVACSLLDNVLFFNEMEDNVVNIQKSRCKMISILKKALPPMEQKVMKITPVYHDNSKLQICYNHTPNVPYAHE